MKNAEIATILKTYQRHVELDSITIMEASTNSTMVKNLLQSAGYRAEVVRADIITCKERKRKVCDIMDAENLGLAYIRGEADSFVWTPSDEYAEYRDIMFAYRDAIKDMTRCSNRIWSICSQKGYQLPVRSGKTKAAQIQKMIEELGITGAVKERLDILVEQYRVNLETRDRLMKIMAEIVVTNPKMLKLMQLSGVNFRGAFAIDSATEDARRFERASKYKAYCGYAPILNTSGTEEDKAKKKGGTGKPLDGTGRRDIKFFLTEAGNTVLDSCSGTDLNKCGWRHIYAGKPRNKVVCAIAGKLATYAWHIQRGDPTPNRDSEAMFKRKMIVFFSDIGKKRMTELGYASRTQFAEYWADKFYGHLPKVPSVVNER